MPASNAAAPDAAIPDVFDVSEYGTLTRRGARVPTTQREALDIAEGEPADLDRLAHLATYHDPLSAFLQQLAESLLEQRENDLDDPELADTDAEREEIEAQWDELRDLQREVVGSPEGWRAWLPSLDAIDARETLEAVRRWLDGEPDWQSLEDAGIDVGPQIQALRFFEDMDSDVLDRLGVKLVYGEHPGSSYYAAELCIDISEANARAQRAGVPLRFLRAGQPFLQLVFSAARS